MNVIFKDEARQDIKAFQRQLQVFFAKHLEKLSRMPPRRHLGHGIPFNVENVTKQARLVYNESENTLYVIRCFATHKEYERWYQSYK